MPFAGGLLSRLGRASAISLFAIVLVAGVVQRAQAQNFTFTPASEFANGGGSVLFSSLTITASATSNEFLGLANYFQYNITGISGTFNGDAITGLLTPGTDVGPMGATISLANNAVFTNGSQLTGQVITGRDDGNSVLASGFGFTTSAGNFLVCDSDCVPANGAAGTALFVFGSAGQINSSFGGFDSAVAVPGPLAGAGMLSWLAVMVMGLAWRRQWLLGRMRAWLAAMQQLRQPRFSSHL